MITVTVNTPGASPFSAAKIKRLVKIAGRFEKKITGEVEINIVSDRQIKELNRRYRGKNKVTDVLSFAWRETRAPQPKDVLGQMYICWPQIKRQAKKFNVAPANEFRRMIVHGLLHLVGYDHLKAREAKKMFALQEKIISQR